MVQLYVDIMINADSNACKHGQGIQECYDERIWYDRFWAYEVFSWNSDLVINRNMLQTSCKQVAVPIEINEKLQ